jgi:hypothetical protein
MLTSSKSGSDPPTTAAAASAADGPLLFAQGEPVPPKALILPKHVSVLDPEVNPLSQYDVVGAPRSVALGTRWAHQVFGVSSGACLLALANGEKPPPGCI